MKPAKLSPEQVLILERNKTFIETLEREVKAGDANEVEERRNEGTCFMVLLENSALTNVGPGQAPSPNSPQQVAHQILFNKAYTFPEWVSFDDLR